MLHPHDNYVIRQLYLPGDRSLRTHRTTCIQFYTKHFLKANMTPHQKYRTVVIFKTINIFDKRASNLEHFDRIQNCIHSKTVNPVLCVASEKSSFYCKWHSSLLRRTQGMNRRLPRLQDLVQTLSEAGVVLIWEDVVHAPIIKHVLQGRETVTDGVKNLCHPSNYRERC